MLIGIVILLVVMTPLGAFCAGGAVPSLNEFYDVTINGCPQRILVQSNDESKPVLLYLHGGPGSSLLTLSHLYSEKLFDDFIFVNWDQRGTAFSYHDGMDGILVSEVQIQDDALELSRYLMRTFHKEKIFLLGHSFGSVIGLRLAAEHPDCFFAYIGVGQVIDYERSVAITYDWLHETLEKAGDTAELRRIEADRFPYIDLVIKYGGHHRLSLDLEQLKTTSPWYYDGYTNLANKGLAFSQYWVGHNLETNPAPLRIPRVGLGPTCDLQSLSTPSIPSSRSPGRSTWRGTCRGSAMAATR